MLEGGLVLGDHHLRDLGPRNIISLWDSEGSLIFPLVVHEAESVFRPTFGRQIADIFIVYLRTAHVFVCYLGG